MADGVWYTCTYEVTIRKPNGEEYTHQHDCGVAHSDKAKAEKCGHSRSGLSSKETVRKVWSRGDIKWPPRLLHIHAKGFGHRLCHVEQTELLPYGESKTDDCAWEFLATVPLACPGIPSYLTTGRSMLDLLIPNRVSTEDFMKIDKLLRKRNGGKDDPHMSLNQSKGDCERAFLARFIHRNKVHRFRRHVPNLRVVQGDTPSEPQPEAQPEPQPQTQPQTQPKETPMQTQTNENAQAMDALRKLLGQGSVDASQVEAIVDQRIAQATQEGKLTATIKVVGKEWKHELPEGEHTHERYEDVLRWLSKDEYVLLKGPAGTGKSALGPQCAKAMGLPFASMSLTGGTTESHFTGRALPNAHGQFVHHTTPFLEAFEKGGLVLLDEVDACDENVLLSINNGIANGVLPVPARHERPFANRHKDFHMIATANTWGHGPDAEYVGRNQLDAAFLDRFAPIEVTYDERLERKLTGDCALTTAWHQLRAKAGKAKLRRVISMRGLIRMHKMFVAEGWSAEKCIDFYTSSWTKDERVTVGVAK